MRSEVVPPVQSLCLTLPAYNEAGVIETLVLDAQRVFRESGVAWSIIVVDDGSTDDTASIIRKMSCAIPELSLVSHGVNMGLGRAIRSCLGAGLSARPSFVGSESHFILCMDADLTHPPDTIPRMCEKADTGCDLVIASRYRPGSSQRGVPIFRRGLSIGARLLFSFYLGIPGVRDYTCGFRALRGTLVEKAFEVYGEENLITRSGFACTDELLINLAMLGAEIGEVPFVLRYDRKVGESKLDLKVTLLETFRLLRDKRKLLKSSQSGD